MTVSYHIRNTTYSCYEVQPRLNVRNIRKQTHVLFDNSDMLHYVHYAIRFVVTTVVLMRTSIYVYSNILIVHQSTLRGNQRSLISLALRWQTLINLLVKILLWFSIKSNNAAQSRSYSNVKTHSLYENKKIHLSRTL